MIEFGSDFHYCMEFSSNEDNFLQKKQKVYFANGRQAIQHLILNNKWERMWIPTYFCYPIVETIKQTGINVSFYDDSPLYNDENIIKKINFNSKDVLLRINYFGLRGWRDNNNIPITVIEDHSHDLCGEWAEKSNADWIIASLRKTLPVPEGGILWSPKNHKIPIVSKSTIENDLLTYKRFSAMLMKSLYLLQQNITKDIYRSLFINTEDYFEKLSICSIENLWKILIEKFNIEDWYNKKKENWYSLLDINCKNICVIQPEKIINCNPFSLILKFNKQKERDYFRNYLLRKNVYPAILWNIPQEQSKNIVNISQKLLSIHCDARYNNQNIHLIKNLINAFNDSLFEKQ